jgi:hypothetical protein
MPNDGPARAGTDTPGAARPTPSRRLKLAVAGTITLAAPVIWMGQAVAQGCACG